MTDYKIGYGKPPKATRFKRGRSGNPKGRPKGSSNLATDLAEELNEMTTIDVDGRPRRVTKRRAWVKTLLDQALDGDVRASNAILAAHPRAATEPVDIIDEAVEPDETKILRRLAPRLLRSISTKRTKEPDAFFCQKTRRGSQNFWVNCSRFQVGNTTIGSMQFCFI
jgi:hypothetical protein